MLSAEAEAVAVRLRRIPLRAGMGKRGNQQMDRTITLSPPEMAFRGREVAVAVALGRTTEIPVALAVWEETG